jgi:hypothetical protein
MKHILRCLLFLGLAAPAIAQTPAPVNPDLHVVRASHTTKRKLVEAGSAYHAERNPIASASYLENALLGYGNDGPMLNLSEWRPEVRHKYYAVLKNASAKRVKSVDVRFESAYDHYSWTHRTISFDRTIQPGQTVKLSKNVGTEAPTTTLVNGKRVVLKPTLERAVVTHVVYADGTEWFGW